MLCRSVFRSDTLLEWGLGTHTRAAGRLGMLAWETPMWWGMGTRSLEVWG